MCSIKPLTDGMDNVLSTTCLSIVMLHSVQPSFSRRSWTSVGVSDLAMGFQSGAKPAQDHPPLIPFIHRGGVRGFVGYVRASPSYM